MFFYVGALALALFGSIAITILLGLPWWTSIIFTLIAVSVRLIITTKEPHQKIMDVGNGMLIVLAIWKVVL